MSDIVKVSFIRKRKNYYYVMSEKGKVLGKYKTKHEALKRLRQIEFFKHKKASSDSYSSIMRELNKSEDKELLNEFRKVYKKCFDEAYLNDEENPEEIALKKAKDFLSENEELHKTSSFEQISNDFNVSASLIKKIMKK